MNKLYIFDDNRIIFAPSDLHLSPAQATAVRNQIEDWQKDGGALVMSIPCEIIDLRLQRGVTQEDVDKAIELALAEYQKHLVGEL